MRQISIKLADGNVKTETIYNIDDYPYGDLFKRRKVLSRNRKNVIADPATFDIETTTIAIPKHDRKKNGAKYERVFGFMYLWAVDYQHNVCMGRTFEELIEFYKRLVKSLRVNINKHLVIYVHNLAFEFQFIRDFFEWESVFAKDEREVLKAVTVDGLEFRCSYYLTNMSLQKACENARNCLHYKRDGEKFDYNKIRTPSTPLSDYELEYQFCDVEGLLEVVEDYLVDDDLLTIPLTATGFVRRDCRNAMRKNPENRELFRRCEIDEDTYKLLQEEKRGGNTHANRNIVGQILRDVKSNDVASSYPFQMCCRYFPVSAFTRYGIPADFSEFADLLSENCCLFRVEFENFKLKPEAPVPYVSVHKLNTHSAGQIVYNGRLLYSKLCSMTLNEIDFKIIAEQYTWDNMYLSDVYIAEKGELPQELKDVIIDYFTRKTMLKGVEGREYEYGWSKRKINAIFGMTFTDPVRDEIIISDGELLGRGTWKKEKNDVSEQLHKYFTSRNSFLPIQWGNWVTAHAREWLQRMIDASGENTLYCDTDCDQTQNMPDGWLDELNAEAIRLAEKNGAYADRDGKRYYMGVYESEKDKDRFRTWGAKKYAFEDDRGLHITVAGVGKKKGADYLKNHGGLEAFEPGFIWPDQNSGGGTDAYWNDDGINYAIINGERILSGANVGILSSSYTFGESGIFNEKANFDLLF